MDDQKIENLLNLALDATAQEREKSESLEVGFEPETQTWEVIVRYSGNLRDAAPADWQIAFLSGGYAIVTLPQADVNRLAALPQIEYVEKPKRMYFSVDAGRQASCISALQTSEFNLFGRGILTAVIDSGVDYFHPDFRNEDGTTRILAMWDQTEEVMGSRSGELTGSMAASQTVNTVGRVQGATKGRVSGSVAVNQAVETVGRVRETVGGRLSGSTMASQTARTADRMREATSGSMPGRLSGSVMVNQIEARAGRIPSGFASGMEYTKEDIDRALAAASGPGGRAAGLAIVPEQDLSGHGTQVLGIAAGNGRASGGQYRGVAPESDIIVVKLGMPREQGFPRTTELMMAIEYVYRKAEEFGMPMAVNISFGNAYGSHRGTSLLETYIDMMAARGRSVIAVGTGNEGNSGGHVSGRLGGSTAAGSAGSRSQNENPGGIGSVQRGVNPGTGTGAVGSGNAVFGFGEQEIELLVGEFETSLNLQIWKNYVDEFRISLIAPNGRTVGPFGQEIGASRYQLGATDLLVYYGEPSPYQSQQEIYIDFIPRGAYIDSGVWRIVLTPQRIVTGEYEMWLNDARARNPATRFQRPSSDVTMTIPSAASQVIAVGAYDARQNAYASFSGRGWPDTVYGVRPDLVAPGVDITTTAVGGGYVTVTGTSFAAPFVTGSAALLMQWGEGGIIRLRQKKREISEYPGGGVPDVPDREFLKSQIRTS